VTQDTEVAGRYEGDNEFSGSIKGGKFVDE
jgi:hypothetical protein